VKISPIVADIAKDGLANIGRMLFFEAQMARQQLYQLNITHISNLKLVVLMLMFICATFWFFKPKIAL
jgi:hypothetical protein